MTAQKAMSKGCMGMGFIHGICMIIIGYVK